MTRLLLGPLGVGREAIDPPAVVGIDVRTFGPVSASITYAPTDPLERLFLQLPPAWTPDALIWWAPEHTPVPLGIETCSVPSVAIVRDWQSNFWATRPILDAFDLVLVEPRACDVFQRAGVAHVRPWTSSSLACLVDSLADLRSENTRRPFGRLRPAERAFRLGVKAFLSATRSGLVMAELTLGEAAEDADFRHVAHATLASLFAAAAAMARDPDSRRRLLDRGRRHAVIALEAGRADPLPVLIAAELELQAEETETAAGLLRATIQRAQAAPSPEAILPVPVRFEPSGFRAAWESAAMGESQCFGPSVVSLVEARAWRRLGEIAEAAGDPAGSIAAFSQSLAAHPDVEDTHYALARLFQAARHDDEAITHYRQTVARAPHHFAARGTLAYLLYNLGRTEESAALCEESLRLVESVSSVPREWGPVFEDLRSSCRRRLGMAPPVSVSVPAAVTTTHRVLNKLADTQDLQRLARRAVAQRLVQMKALLDEAQLPYSRQAADHWLRIWEYSGAVVESGVDGRMRVLDAGGTGTVLSYYLAAEGCRVTTVDINPQKLADTRTTTPALGLAMDHVLASITDLPFAPESFDAVFCVCVIEHVARAEQGRGMRELGRVLRPGGVLAVTFDYGCEGADNPFLSPQEVVDRLIVPSELAVIGNPALDVDPEDFGGATARYTFGSLFLGKPGRLLLPPESAPMRLDAFPALARREVAAARA